MASRKESPSLKVIAKKKGKTNKKLTWTDQDTDVFAEVISDPLYRESDYTVGWATVLERLALKKSSTIATLRVPQYWLLNTETPVV